MSWSSGDATAPNHLTDTADAHDASAISVLDSANQYTATDVEAALAEVLDAEQAHEGDTSSAHAAASVNAVEVINGGQETVGAVGNTGTAVTIVLTTGNVQTYTVNGNCTFTMPSGLTSGKAISFTAILTDSGGPRTITFTGVLWSGGTNPTVMSAASAVDIFTFHTIDGGTTWYGFVAGTRMAT